MKTLEMLIAITGKALSTEASRKVGHVALDIVAGKDSSLVDRSAAAQGLAFLANSVAGPRSPLAITAQCSIHALANEVGSTILSKLPPEEKAHVEKVMEDIEIDRLRELKEAELRISAGREALYNKQATEAKKKDAKGNDVCHHVAPAAGDDSPSAIAAAVVASGGMPMLDDKPLTEQDMDKSSSTLCVCPICKSKRKMKNFYTSNKKGAKLRRVVTGGVDAVFSVGGQQVALSELEGFVPCGNCFDKIASAINTAKKAAEKAEVVNSAKPEAAPNTETPAATADEIAAQESLIASAKAELASVDKNIAEMSNVPGFPMDDLKAEKANREADVKALEAELATMKEAAKATKKDNSAAIKVLTDKLNNLESTRVSVENSRSDAAARPGTKLDGFDTFLAKNADEIAAVKKQIAELS